MPRGGGVGILVNGATALLFMRGRKTDLNLRSAFLHMAADALIAFGVVVVGLAIALSGWLWLDPAIGLVISAIIVYGTWDLVKQSVRLALDAVPQPLDPAAVRAHLLALPGVTALHDLHIWGMSTTETALTCHLVMPGGRPATRRWRTSPTNWSTASASTTQPCRSSSATATRSAR